MGASCLGAVGPKGCKGQHPVIHVGEENGMEGECKSARGGTKTVGVPEYVMTVTNPEEPGCSTN